MHWKSGRHISFETGMASAADMSKPATRAILRASHKYGMSSMEPVSFKYSWTLRGGM
jgi:hypothetical protein